jgi:hypothetical protein
VLAAWDAQYGEALAASRQRHAEARDDLLAEMAAQGVGRLEQEDWRAIVEQRTLIAVEDEDALTRTLGAAGRLGDCLTLDLPKLKRVLKEARKAGWDDALAGYVETVQRNLRLVRRSSPGDQGAPS